MCTNIISSLYKYISMYTRYNYTYMCMYTKYNYIYEFRFLHIYLRNIRSFDRNQFQYLHR